MKEVVTSEVTGKTYNPRDVVRILNMQQACKYIKAKCYPLDIYPSIDFKTGQDVLVWLFNREETKDLYRAWCDHEL